MPRHVRPQPGDYFAVALSSKDAPEPALPPAFGQVLSLEAAALNSVACAFWPEYNDDVAGILATRPISIEIVTPDLLKRKIWPILGNAPVVVPLTLRGYEQYRDKEWVGAEIVGSGNIRELLMAWRGLVPWDDFHDPNYLDGLLLPGMKPPPTARYKRTGA